MFILTVFLIGLASGYDESKCEPFELPKALKCLKNHKDLREKAVTLDLDNEKNMVVLNETCIDFLTCSSSMKCGADEKDLENIEKAISYCHAVAFHVSIEYDLCAEKVDRRNSTCVQEWNPFPDFEEGIEDEKKKEACDNFFGKDGCLEEEITEICSLATWKEFRRHYLALNDIIEACDFKNV